MTGQPDFDQLPFNAEKMERIWDAVQKHLAEQGKVYLPELAEKVSEETDTYPESSLRKAVLPTMGDLLVEADMVVIEQTQQDGRNPNQWIHPEASEDV